MMKPRFLLLALVGTVITLSSSAFTVSLSKTARHLSSSSSSRLPALIYEPDGQVVQDEQGDTRVVREGSTAILEYLNAPDYRGPLAVLVAAHGDVDLKSIQQVTTTDVSKTSITMEALCAADEMACVNVQVSVDFPAVCQDENQVIQNLNSMHEDALAIVEKRRKEKEQEEVMNVRPVPQVPELVVAAEDQAKLDTIEQLKAKRVSFAKQRALLAARLERESKERSLRQERQAQEAAEAREIARQQFKDEMESAAQARREARLAAQEKARRAAQAKREAFAKQRALLAERLQRQERVRTRRAANQDEEKARLDAQAKLKSFERQRALLAERLQREERIRALSRKTQERAEAATSQSKDTKDTKLESESSIEEPENLSDRYGAIEDVGEKAFTILVDLGLVNLTPDPASPDYDASRDEVLVE